VGQVYAAAAEWQGISRLSPAGTYALVKLGSNATSHKRRRCVEGSLLAELLGHTAAMRLATSAANHARIHPPFLCTE
jgi:hypothetical protein